MTDPISPAAGTRADSTPPPPAVDTRALAVRLKTFGRPDSKRGGIELAITLAAFAALWFAMWLSLDYSYWLTLALALPAAGFLVRLFAIQHDCGHGSFFGSRHVNDRIGRLIGVLTLTPYDYWRHAHALHHASSGNLDRRGIGDISTLTVREYRAMPWWRRAGYRLYRNPLVLFGVGPAYLFIVKHRLPAEMWQIRKNLLFGVLATNVAIVGLAAAAAATVGLEALVMIQLPPTVLAASTGVWLFFVQHQFENAYWQHEDRWEFHDAAFHGSSYYRLPKPLQWITASIGLHHIHHLCSRVPSYRLQESMDALPELRQVAQLTLRQSFRCAGLSLWDEDAGRMIGFRDLAKA